MSDDLIIMITPGPGKTSEVGKLLMALADNPAVDVGSTTDGPLGWAYTVPADLYDKYLKAISLKEDQEESEQSDDDPSTEQEPAPRKRGRPRKTAPTPEQES